jgi:Bacterial dnaA protein helix-turn-helix
MSMATADLTPTQREAMERSRRFKASIAQKAADLQVAKLRKALGEQGCELEQPFNDLTPEAMPAEPDPPKELHWFQIMKEVPREIPSIARIQAVVCEYYRVSKMHLVSRRRLVKFVVARHVAMYLARELTGLSLPNISSRFGGRDHTTALHGAKKIAAQILVDENLAHEVAELIHQITGVQQ